MRIVLAGNCQVTPMKQVIEKVLPGAQCTAFEVFAMSEVECDIAAEQALEADVVISQPLAAKQYGGLRSNALKDRVKGGSKLLFIHNLHFEGAAPDCGYIGKLGARVPSPISGYHSRIICNGFKMGLSEEKCAEAVLSGGGMDPCAAWEKSLQEFQKRETLVDVSFAEELAAEVKRRNCFHVFNHPTIDLIGLYTGKILEAITGETVQTAGLDIPDELIKKGVWPVLEWVSDALELPYASDSFIPPYTTQGQNMSVEEFIKSCYAIYERQSPDNLV